MPLVGMPEGVNLDEIMSSENLMLIGIVRFFN